MNRFIQRPFSRARLRLCLVAAAFAMQVSVPFTLGQAQSGQSPQGQNPTNNATPSALGQSTLAQSQAAQNAANAANGNGSTPNNGSQTNNGLLQEQPLPPQKPTEFQDLVQASTNQMLPIFGASLFSGVPSTFAPVNNVPVDPSYVLGPGDNVSVQTVGQVNLQYNLTVDPSGSINVPGLGPVEVAGLTYGQLPAFLNRQFSRLYRGFTLTATLGSLRTIQVFVVGQARRPGTYSISSLSTLLNAVFVSGGPANDGSLRDIQVRRGGQVISHFDLYDLLLRGDKTNDIRLASGDVIFIPFSGPEVAISGSVKSPAIYELKGETTLAQVMALAGGETAIASESYARLERVYEHASRSEMNLNLATNGSEVLRNGDIVTVAAIVDRFRNAVTLRGNVANPGRYAWHQGMHLSELFPDKASLITRNYWNNRNQLSFYNQDYTANGQSTQVGRGSLQVSGTAQEKAQAAANTPEAVSGVSGGSGGTGTGGGTSANTGSKSPPATQAGATVSTALTGTNLTFPAQNDVILSAPDIDWSYAVIERLNTQDLKTSLVPFNLGKLVLGGDASQNYELEPGDVVTIFSTADIHVPTMQQTRFVRLEGEFNSPGLYSVQPGETLRSLLVRAGGFTPEAFLYASEFTRESVRRVEAQRLREYADTLDAQISSVTANNTARAVTAQDYTSAAASEADARQAVARIRQLQPVGRIVLDVKPDSAGPNSVPDLQLEDGDRFVVPRVPSSVNVEGQVYNANAFVFEPGRHMSDYLHRAGGPDRQADKKRAFVLRADGSVISEQYAHVQRSPVYPGDTIVVPPVLDRRAFFQRITDLASIVSGFGYSAATLYLLARP